MQPFYIFILVVVSSLVTIQTGSGQEVIGVLRDQPLEDVLVYTKNQYVEVLDVKPGLKAKFKMGDKVVVKFAYILPGTNVDATVVADVQTAEGYEQYREYGFTVTCDATARLSGTGSIERTLYFNYNNHPLKTDWDPPKHPVIRIRQLRIETYDQKTNIGHTLLRQPVDFTWELSKPGPLQ